jgi:hypothetical protein
MVAMTTSASKLRKKVSGDKSGRAGRAFVSQVSSDYPQFSFKQGTQEHWSPKAQTIMYNPAQPLKKLRYGVLHELAHALLDHTDYKSDFELLKLEAKAWELAAQIGKKYDVLIDNEHIQNCLDTYRDWLHRRSTCPSCETHVLQDSPSSYRCFNCGVSWQVSNGRFVRSYRKKVMRKI